jgi:hypothetical protein
VTTENVAILFTDIVGSTELCQRLSPEAADEVRREHFSILRRAHRRSWRNRGEESGRRAHGGLRLGFGCARLWCVHATSR